MLKRKFEEEKNEKDNHRIYKGEATDENLQGNLHEEQQANIRKEATREATKEITRQKLQRKLQKKLVVKAPECSELVNQTREVLKIKNRKLEKVSIEQNSK